MVVIASLFYHTVVQVQVLCCPAQTHVPAGDVTNGVTEQIRPFLLRCGAVSTMFVACMTRSRLPGEGREAIQAQPGRHNTTQEHKQDSVSGAYGMVTCIQQAPLPGSIRLEEAGITGNSVVTCYRVL